MSYADDQWDEETFGSLIRQVGIGADYMRNREEIERESAERSKNLMPGEEAEESFKDTKGD